MDGRAKHAVCRVVCTLMSVVCNFRAILVLLRTVNKERWYTSNVALAVCLSFDGRSSRLTYDSVTCKL